MERFPFCETNLSGILVYIGYYSFQCKCGKLYLQRSLFSLFEALIPRDSRKRSNIGETRERRNYKDDRLRTVGLTTSKNIGAD